MVPQKDRSPGSTPAVDYGARFMLAQYAALRFERDTPEFENSKKITGLDLSEVASFARQAMRDEWYGKIFWSVVRKMNIVKAMTTELGATQTLFFTLPDAA